MPRITLHSQHFPVGEHGESFLHFESLHGREYINQLFEYHLIVKVSDEHGHPAHGFKGLEGYVSQQQSAQGASPAAHLNLQALLGTFMHIEHLVDGVYHPLQHPLVEEFAQSRYAQQGIALPYSEQELSDTSFQHVRVYHGLISRIEQLSTQNRFSRYQFTLVPWLWLLTQRSRYAIYQQLSVVDIVRQVLYDYPYPVEYRLDGGYPALDYQVQYNESDYHFLHRLLQENGINYFFEHGTEHLVLVLCDQNHYFKRHGHPAYQKLLIHPPEQRFPDQQQYIEQFEIYQQLVNEKHHVHDFHFKQPSQGMENESRAVYRPVLQQQHLVYWAQGDHANEQVGEFKVEHLYESHVQYAQRALAHGQLQGVATGFCFNLLNHPNQALNQEWIVLGVDTFIQDISQQQRQGQHFSCDVRFVCQAKKFAVRPQPFFQIYGDTPYALDQGVLEYRFAVTSTDKGVADTQLNKLTQVTQVDQLAQLFKEFAIKSGGVLAHPIFKSFYLDQLNLQNQEKPVARPQTATVVGSAGEEIYTDAYGRVKVKFHWDRHNAQLSQRYPPIVRPQAQLDSNYDKNVNTCWLRVSTAWAGELYGSMHIPRVGQEVIIDFMNGDPDMPYVSGRLHNAEQMPPWELPSQKALSGIKSKELQGNHYNQLVMDDSTGKVQAQLKSSHQSSELNLGYITRIEPEMGRQREEFRGEGFELRTDGHGVVRADKGLILTAQGRSKASGRVKDITEISHLLKQSISQHKSYARLATEHQAQEQDDQKAVVEKLKQQEEEVRGQQQGQELAAPHMLLHSPAGVAITTNKTTHINTEEHIALTSREHTSISTGKNLLAVAHGAVRFFAQLFGIKLFAAKGKIEVNAQTDAIELSSLKKTKVHSHDDWVEITAKQGILLNAGGSYIKIMPEGIELGTEGYWRVHAKEHDDVEPNRLAFEAESPLFNDEMFQLTNMHGQIMSNIPYKIVTASGEAYYGYTDNNGNTERLFSGARLEDLKVFLYDDNEEN